MENFTETSVCSLLKPPPPLVSLLTLSSPLPLPHFPSLSPLTVNSAPWSSTPSPLCRSMLSWYTGSELKRQVLCSAFSATCSSLLRHCLLNTTSCSTDRPWGSSLKLLWNRWGIDTWQYLWDCEWDLRYRYTIHFALLSVYKSLV